MGQLLHSEQFDAGVGALSGSAATARRGVLYTARKVPEITVYFWIVKLLSTALGESTSDYLVLHLDPYFAVAIGGAMLAIALTVQLVVRRYIAAIYWLTVVLVAMVGTMAADVAHIVLKFQYWQSTIIFAVCLGVVFMVWYASEKTLSIHAIDTRRRELFYWATVMATFALGTAARRPRGLDAPAWLDAGLGLSLRWRALRRPLRAARAGLLAPRAECDRRLLDRLRPHAPAWEPRLPTGSASREAVSGLGFGDGPVSLVLAVLIIAFVAYLTITRRDMPGDARHPLG